MLRCGWLLSLLLAQTAGSVSPFAGEWDAVLSKSCLRPNSPIQSEHLRFDVPTARTVSITDSVVTTAGKEIGQGTTTFQVDGEIHPHDELLPGLTVVARWNGPRRLETALTRTNGM